VFARDSSKLLLTLAIAVLLALGLSACGGGSDSTSSGAASTSNAENGSDAGSSGGSQQGSASFRVPGGDNSIQEFGEEADSAELEVAEKALAGYLDARAAGNWKQSCNYLSEDALAPLEKVAATTPQLKGADCGEILEGLQGSASKSEIASPLINGLAALRVEGDTGFALFRGPKDAPYYVLMAKQGDDWKVGGLAPTEFP
jgi:hypothetical protein